MRATQEHQAFWAILTHKIKNHLLQSKLARGNYPLHGGTFGVHNGPRNELVERIIHSSLEELSSYVALDSAIPLGGDIEKITQDIATAIEKGIDMEAQHYITLEKYRPMSRTELQTNISSLGPRICAIAAADFLEKYKHDPRIEFTRRGAHLKIQEELIGLGMPLSLPWKQLHGGFMGSDKRVQQALASDIAYAGLGKHGSAEKLYFTRGDINTLVGQCETMIEEKAPKMDRTHTAATLRDDSAFTGLVEAGKDYTGLSRSTSGPSSRGLFR